MGVSELQLALFTGLIELTVRRTPNARAKQPDEGSL